MPKFTKRSFPLSLTFILCMLGCYLAAITNTATAATTTTKNAKLLDKVAAIVNDDIITSLEVDQHTKLLLSRIDYSPTDLPPKDILRQQILNQMLMDKIQLQLADSLGLEADSASVDEAMKDLAKSENLSLTELRQQQTNKGINFAALRKHVSHELIISKLRQREISQEIVISSADIDGYLNSPAGQDQTGTEYRVGHILLSTPSNPTPSTLSKFQAQAEDLVKSLKAGVNFSEIAMAKSSGQHALKGGDLGWKRISEMPTIFIKHVTNMQPEEIAGPIRSANGFHIIKLLGKRVGNKEVHVESHVRHILIKSGINLSDSEAKQNLTDIRKQIVNGANFATMAEQKSEELSTATKGGDLGWITDKTVTPEFYKKIMALKPKELSQVFKTDLGWHLIEVLGRRSQDDSIEAARNKAAEVLRMRKYNEMLESWLKRIRSEAKIETFI